MAIELCEWSYKPYPAMTPTYGELTVNLSQESGYPLSYEGVCGVEVKIVCPSGMKFDNAADFEQWVIDKLREFVG